MIFENLEYIFRSFKVNNVDKGCELGKANKDQGSLFREKQLGLVSHSVQRILLNQQHSHHLKVGPAPFQLFFVFFHIFLKLVMSGFFFKLTPLPSHFQSCCHVLDVEVLNCKRTNIMYGIK